MTTMESLLTMLLTDVPRTDFEATLAGVERRREDGNPQGVPTLRELEIVTELRHELERHRTRASGLRGLFETACDLTSLQDIEAVLQAIVRRSRQLLATDVAYLMLIDTERGDTYMRVTVGTVAPDFTMIRLPMGIGLGGLVAEECSPHWTADYLGDHRFVHHIDDVVIDEHLVAILGVPLKIDRRLLGVLFAADRQARTFSQDEISLLSSLADYAAIAIENASVFRDTVNTMSEITTAKKLLDISYDRLQASIDFHEQLMSRVLEGGSTGDVAHAVVETLGGSLAVLDSEGRELARAGVLPFNEAEQASGTLARTAHGRDLVARADAERRSFLVELGACEYRVVPIAAGGECVGAIVWSRDTATDVDVSMLQWAATVMALLLLSARARDEIENRVREELLVEVLTVAQADRTGLIRRARLLDVDLDQDWIVLVAQPSSGVVTRAVRDRCSALASTMRGLAAARVDHVVLIVPGADAEAAADSAAMQFSRLADDGVVTVGGVGPCRDLQQVATLAEQARICAQAMEVLGRRGRGGTANQMGVYGVLLASNGHPQFEAWITGVLGPIRDYDERRRTSLMETLTKYFEHEGRVASAAEALVLHPNTMYQRLSRLDRLLGEDWRSGDRALEVRLALRFDQLRQMYKPV
jgi:DNA-binding PucR family transcriptional regulator